VFPKPPGHDCSDFYGPWGAAGAGFFKHCELGTDGNCKAGTGNICLKSCTDNPPNGYGRDGGEDDKSMR